MGQIIVKGIDQIRPFLEGRKFLLVRDQSYNHLEIKKVFDQVPHVEFTGFTSNPLYEQVCAGVNAYHEQCCEMIVAVGGGSAIDVAKCIKLFSRMDPHINYLKQEMIDTGILLIAVPTTAGTGSESTCHAVIYHEAVKQSICHSSIIPDYAVLEPSVLKTLPVYQKKCTMLDALCQAIESWWSINSNDESIEFSKKAILDIRNHWKAYINDNTEEAAEKIIEAANYAGRAINITATTAAHAMSYKITSIYKLPHGHAVSVCMTTVWKYILEHTDQCVDNRGEEYLKNTLKEIKKLIDYDWYCSLLEKLEMGNPQSINRERELRILTQSVNSDRLKNSPVELKPEVIREMYERIVKK